MGVSAQEIAANGDEDHGLGDVEASFVVADEAPPSGHPANGALDDPSAGLDLEALLVVRAQDDLNDEVEIGGFVHQLPPGVGAVGEQMFDPRPSLADAVQGHLGPGPVGDVGGR